MIQLNLYLKYIEENTKVMKINEKKSKKNCINNENIKIYE